MMRNKQICINLTKEEYDSLVFLANKDRRKLAEYVYYIVSDYISENILKAVDVHSEIEVMR